MKTSNRKHPRAPKGVGQVGAGREQAQGLPEEVPLPWGPEGQAQLEELVELGAGRLAQLCPTLARSRRPSLLGPSWGAPSSSHPSGLHAGPRHNSQPPCEDACRPARPQPRSGHI